MSARSQTIQRFGGVQPNELRPEKKAEIIRMLRAQLPPPVVSRRAGVSRTTVLKLASREGIVPAQGRLGRPPGSSGRRRKPETKAPTPATPTSGPNYRAIAAGLRWGSGLGGGFGW